MQLKVRWFVGAALLMLTVVSLGPVQAQDFGSSLGFTSPGDWHFDLATNTSYVEYTTIEDTLDGVTRIGQAKRSYFVEIVESETSLHEWAREFIRLEYLAPEEVAGDVYIFEVFRGERKLYFWNDELVTPLLINTSFEVFGNLPLSFFMPDPNFGLRCHQRVEGDEDVVLDSSHVAQPETVEEKLFIGREIQLIQRQWEACPEIADEVMYPRERVVTYNTRLAYQRDYMDADGNVLLEKHNEDWRNFDRVLYSDGRHTGRYYVTETLYVDRVIPGHTTRIIIDEVGYEQVELSQFDPNLLGQ